MSIIKRNNNVLFPSLMNEIFKPDWFGGMDNYSAQVPAVNIKENEKDYELELAVPGMNKDDFNVEVDHNIMTVSAEIENEDTETRENYTRREFSYSSFKRSFTLPDTIADDKIKAAYKDGVLKLTLPKKEEALPKPKRMISIGK